MWGKDIRLVKFRVPDFSLRGLFFSAKPRAGVVRALSPLCVRNCASALAETGPLCEVGAGGKVALRGVLGKVSSSTSVRVPKSQLPHVQLRAGTASPLYKTRLGSGLDAGVGALAAPVLVLPARWLDRAFQERFLDF